MKSLFYELGQQRSQFAGELQTLVRELGGDPESTGSTSAALHRGWINIKSLVTGQDETAILNEAERGEDIAKAAYEKATQMQLPSNVLSVIQQQATQVKAAHDRVRDLRDSMSNAANRKSELIFFSIQNSRERGRSLFIWKILSKKKFFSL